MAINGERIKYTYPEALDGNGRPLTSIGARLIPVGNGVSTEEFKVQAKIVADPAQEAQRFVRERNLSTAVIAFSACMLVAVGVVFASAKESGQQDTAEAVTVVELPYGFVLGEELDTPVPAQDTPTPIIKETVEVTEPVSEDVNSKRVVIVDNDCPAGLVIPAGSRYATGRSTKGPNRISGYETRTAVPLEGGEPSFFRGVSWCLINREDFMPNGQFGYAQKP